MLGQIAESLDSNKVEGHTEQMNASKYGITGTVLAVASVPFTGGLSLLALGAGTAIGIYGAYKGIKSGMDVRDVESNLLEEAKKTLHEDEEEVKKFETVLDDINGGIASAAGVAPGTAFILSKLLVAPKLASKAGSIVSKGIAGTGKIAGKAATGTAASTILKRGGIALAVVSVPLEVWTYLDNAKKLEEPSPTAMDIRSLIVKLMEDLVEKRTLLASLKEF